MVALMNKPSTALYQQHRTNTLRAATRAQELATALQILRENRKAGFSYPRKTEKLIRDGITGTDGVRT